MANICDNYTLIVDRSKDKTFMNAMNKLASLDGDYEDGLLRMLWSMATGEEIETSDTPLHRDQDIYDAAISDEWESGFCLGYDTRWSPIETNSWEILREVFDIEVSCCYSEPGCDFAGKMTITREESRNDSMKYISGLYLLWEDEDYAKLQIVDNMECTEDYEEAYEFGINVIGEFKELVECTPIILDDIRKTVAEEIIDELYGNMDDRAEFDRLVELTLKYI